MKIDMPSRLDHSIATPEGRTSTPPLDSSDRSALSPLFQRFRAALLDDDAEGRLDAILTKAASKLDAFLNRRRRPLSLRWHAVASWARQRQYDAALSPSDERWISTNWEFTRHMLAHPELADLPSSEAVHIVNNLLREWIESHGNTAEAWGLFVEGERCRSVEDAIVGLVAAWDSIRFPASASPLVIIMQQVDTDHRLEITGRRSMPTVGYERFLQFAARLQLSVGECNTIGLPVREVGEALGCNKGTVKNYRRYAVEDGFLQVMAEHSFRQPGKADRGTQFRFDLERIADVDDNT